MSSTTPTGSSSVCLEYDHTFRPNVSSEISESEQTLSAVLFVFTVCWLTICLIFFLRTKNRYSKTRIRVGLFTCTFWLGDILLLIGWILPLAIGIDNFPCWVSCACVALMMGCYNAANFTRNSTFMLMTGLSYATQENGRIPLDKIAEVEESHAKLTLLQRTVEELSLIWFGLKFVFTPNSVRRKKSPEEHIRLLVALRFVSRTQGAAFFTCVCVVPYVICAIVMCLAIPTYRENCRGCAPDSRAIVYMGVTLGGVLLVFSGMFNVKCRNLPDVFGVFSEELLSHTWMGVAFIGVLIVGFVPIEQRYFGNILVVIGLVMAFFGVTVFQIFLSSRRESPRPSRTSPAVGDSHRPGSMIMGINNNNNNKLPSSTASEDQTTPSSPHLSKSGSTILNKSFATTTIVSDIKSMCPTLHDILLSPPMTRLLEIHILREFADENLNFLQNISEWKSVYNDIAKSASAARAKKIVNSFIRDKGLQQINIPYSIAQKLVALADKPDAMFEMSAFDEARTEVARLLEIGAVARYVRSPEYRSLMSDQAVISALSGEMT